MSEAKKNITGFILAGGRSSRMGEEKGLKLLNGKPMVEHVIEEMKPCVDELILIANNDAYKQFQLPVISDLIKNIGPAGGIFAGLSHTATQRNFFISCDIPFITSEVIQSIMRNSEGAEITIPVINHRMEPLCGVYSKSCLLKWELLIKAGIIKLQELITHFNLRFHELNDDKYFTMRQFANINTREQFENAIQFSETWK